MFDFTIRDVLWLTRAAALSAALAIKQRAVARLARS
jgi:hypothetical protein